ncbi:unnamed protein product [Lactuca virosa]|uniref:NB-ARC domain-containing protein n=1 Tax=Lactuca virosa TaxID=75947 RepID=A0AAU9MKJ3_9ASTR|nr:unnamed protein product [Lactuca virosa]
MFYKVEPSDVQNQTGCFKDAFDVYDDEVNLETNLRKKKKLLEKVGAWTDYLNKAATFTGLVYKDGYESKFIINILNVVIKKVDNKALHIEEKLVGIKDHLAEIQSWLKDRSPDAVVLLIDGMGGIGKSTISKCKLLSGRHTWLLTAFKDHGKVHSLGTLSMGDATELLSLHAFGQHQPIEPYIVHLELVVQRCKGLPLALKVLGSSLREKTNDEWEDAIHKLAAIPHREIQEVLQISYETLADDKDKDGNNITFLPKCVQTLPRIEELRVSHCSKLHSVLSLPNSVNELFVNDNESLEKVQPAENSRTVVHHMNCPNLCEIEGRYKIQSIDKVERKIIRYLGLESNACEGMEMDLEGLDLEIGVQNKTKYLLWSYFKRDQNIRKNAGKFALLCLWRCGNLLEGGDEIIIRVFSRIIHVEECCINLIYEDYEELLDEERKEAHDVTAFDQMLWTDRMDKDISHYAFPWKKHVFRDDHLEYNARKEK